MGLRPMTGFSWDWSFAWSILPALLKGLAVTVQATLAGFLIAFVGGLALCLLRLARLPLLSPLAWFVIEFLRGTPFLVQLYFTFYVLPNYGIIFSPFITGTLALGIYGAARAAEFYRSALEAIPPGQWEAALTLKLPLSGVWFRIILPQMWPVALPMLGNLMIAMFKDTAVLSTITVLEMVAVAKDIGVQTFRYLEPLTMAGILFWCVSYLTARVIRTVEEKHAS